MSETTAPTSNDAAGDLKAAPLPIPTEQRLAIYLVQGTGYDAAKEWTKQTGLGDFFPWDTPDPAKFCGVCLFVGEFFSPEQWAQIKTFFVRAGNEANVFQFVPHDMNFVRRSEEWFDRRVTT